MVDKVRLLKIENSSKGSQTNFGPTEINPQEDYAAIKGVSFGESDDHTIDLDEAGNIRFKDTNHSGGKTLKSINDDIASEAQARQDADQSIVDQTNTSIDQLTTAINNEANTRSQADQTITDNLNSFINGIGNTVRGTLLTGLNVALTGAIVAGDTLLAALGKIQNTLSAHIGSGGGSHAVATTTVHGFMSATDKVRLDGLKARIVATLCPLPVQASATTFTVVTNSIPFLWINSRNIYNAITLLYNCTYVNRSFELRLVNTTNGAVLATSIAHTTSGFFSITIPTNLWPTTDCELEIQIRKTTSGGTNPTLNIATLELETII